MLLLATFTLLLLCSLAIPFTTTEGSASTVTLMRQGLAAPPLPALPVSIMMDLLGEAGWNLGAWGLVDVDVDVDVEVWW